MKSLLDDVKNLNFTLPSECVTIFGSARFDDNNKFCKKAYELSKMLSNSGFTIVTGGGGGIMKASNKAAFENNTQSVGINVVLPNEQKLNEFVTDGTVFSNLALRKVALIEKSSYFIIFPGGFGTLDELFEVLVLVQNGIKEAKIFLYGVEFYKPLIEFLKTSLLFEKTICSADLDFFTLTDDINLIYEEIIKSKI
ncbi:TIGR00730 family Rossman fold protein [Campylobacter ureolyticus]|uniref:LOG family protein n=1 Tax=Campylobacter ureolyticus TaxID=827 RepID=UPI0022B426DD|nr:TIGR00730 family Rossman fold protein [Campylobacter ureolyticus]MCZ6104690.1 TIGR00730 family Rossman fold protein [Campylobacter ureolyticus]